MNQVTSDAFNFDKIAAWFKAKAEGNQQIGTPCGSGRCIVEQYLDETLPITPVVLVVGTTDATVRENHDEPSYNVPFEYPTQKLIGAFDYYTDHRPYPETVDYDHRPPVYYEEFKPTFDAVVAHLRSQGFEVGRE